MTTSFSRRQTRSCGREIGHRLADADVPIDPTLRQAIQPEMPAGRAFGHADSRHHLLHASPTGGDSSQDIGMKQKSLDNLGFLGCQKSPQAMRHNGKLPHASAAETMDFNAGRHQGRQARGLFPPRLGRQTVDDGSEAAAVDPDGKLGQAPFGAAGVQVGNAQGDSDVLRHDFCAAAQLHRTPCNSTGQRLILVFGEGGKVQIGRCDVGTGRLRLRSAEET